MMTKPGTARDRNGIVIALGDRVRHVERQDLGHGVVIEVGHIAAVVRFQHDGAPVDTCVPDGLLEVENF